jgi:four helix bundle protein
MKVYSFEKLKAWQEARELVSQVYLDTSGFPKDEIFGITNQMRRAAID